MCFWSAQAIYSRAFYAAGNTFVPMAAGTLITIISLPIYAGFYHWQGAMGLAIASNIGIAMQTVTIALLLHKRRMVSLASLDYAELGRCLLAALASGALVWILFSWLGGIAARHWAAAGPRCRSAHPHPRHAALARPSLTASSSAPAPPCPKSRVAASASAKP